jgi:predicted metalloendopeptidase
VKINRSTFFDNYFSFVKYAVEKQYSSAGEPVDKEEWGMTPQVAAKPLIYADVRRGTPITILLETRSPN